MVTNPIPPRQRTKTRPSRLHNPETGKLDLVKVGKWAGALLAILAFVGAIGRGAWGAFKIIDELEDTKTSAASCVTRLNALEKADNPDPGAGARVRIADAIRAVDRDSRVRDSTNARALAVIGNTVDVLHGGTYRPVVPRRARPPSLAPRTRAAQIRAAREDADRATEQAQTTAEDRGDPLGSLQGL